MGGYFHHRGGQVGAVSGLLLPAVPGVGGEHLGAALAAEQDHPLVKHAQAADLHRPGGPHEGVRRHLVVIAHVHRVEAPVEADGLHVDVNIDQFRLAGLDADGTVDHRLAVLGGIKAEILNAVFIGRYSVL